MTLRRDQIEWACADSAALIELLRFGMDEVVELRELAEVELDRGNEDIAQHLEQEKYRVGPHRATAHAALCSGIYDAHRTAPARVVILILMRHGKSGYPDGVRDHERPLAERGRRGAALARRAMDRRRRPDPPTPRRVRTTATRTRQTLERTGIDAPVIYVDDIYGGNPDRHPRSNPAARTG